MADFMAKMHQIRFRLGLRPRPGWESLQRSPRPPSWILGLLLREEEGRRGQGRGRGGEGRRGDRRGGERSHCSCFTKRPLIETLSLGNILHTLLIVPTELVYSTPIQYSLTSHLTRYRSFWRQFSQPYHMTGANSQSSQPITWLLLAKQL